MKDAENWVGQKVACHKFLKVEGHKGEEGRSEEEKKEINN